MRKYAAVALGAMLLISCLLSGCSGLAKQGQKQYTATYFDVFDTVTTVLGSAENEAAFEQTAQKIHDELLFYHRLFDIYHSYDEINNLKTVNEQAAKAPVQVDPLIVEFLLDCKECYVLSGGNVNVAMGSVLQLWHEARTNGIDDPANAYLPDIDALQNAAMHINMDDVILNTEESTVYFADKELKLDVGAIAKGWAVEKVARDAPEGILISVGGNVCVTGPKQTGKPWVIGIQDPDNPEANLCAVSISGGSVVTSGDYQRGYYVEDRFYHHIIDPNTLMPAQLWQSVTVICEDSSLADALSTALFLLPKEEGSALAEKCDAEVMWVDTQGMQWFTDDFKALMRS